MNVKVFSDVFLFQNDRGLPRMIYSVQTERLFLFNQWENLIFGKHDYTDPLPVVKTMTYCIQKAVRKLHQTTGLGIIERSTLMGQKLRIKDTFILMRSNTLVRTFTETSMVDAQHELNLKPLLRVDAVKFSVRRFFCLTFRLWKECPVSALCKSKAVSFHHRKVFIVNINMTLGIFVALSSGQSKKTSRGRNVYS